MVTISPELESSGARAAESSRQLTNSVAASWSRCSGLALAMPLVVSILVELAFLPTLLNYHRCPADCGSIVTNAWRSAPPVALAKASAKKKKPAKVKAPGAICSTFPRPSSVSQAATRVYAGGAGFGAVAAPPPPKRSANPAGPNPFDNENFVISDVTLPVEDGQSTLFLGTFMIEDPSVCDDLVAAFEADSANHKIGVVGRQNVGQVRAPQARKFSRVLTLVCAPSPGRLSTRAARTRWRLSSFLMTLGQRGSATWPP